jgi:hypothetical protein
MKDWYANMIDNWKELLNDRKFFIKYVLNFVVCYSIYMLGVRFLLWNRLRPGVVLDDPIQHLFTPLDFSFPTFLLTYVSIVSFIIYLIGRPREFYFGARAFTAAFVLRVGFIYLVPLSTPPQTILLKDPFLDAFIWGNVPITNDLFYSGHVADICIFIFLCRNMVLRYFLIACAAAVGLMVVWQHVHYTADVIASPFFAYACYTVFAKGKVTAPSASGVSATERFLSMFTSSER